MERIRRNDKIGIWEIKEKEVPETDDKGKILTDQEEILRESLVQYVNFLRKRQYLSTTPGSSLVFSSKYLVQCSENIFNATVQCLYLLTFSLIPTGHLQFTAVEDYTLKGH